MKLQFSLKHFLLELSGAVAISAFFSLFAQTFIFWFVICLLLLLIWHHYSEFTLLQWLNPNKPSNTKKRSSIEHLSQTAAFYQANTRREKLQAFRLLSKLNRNIHYLPDAIIICEPNGEISWCNQAALQLFEFFWDKKSSKNILNVIFYPEFKSYFQQQKHQRPLVILSHNKRYIEIHLHHYDDESILLIARDVTAFLRLLHSRQTFLANINHELRTPLTVLQGYLEMLEMDVNNPQLQQKAIDAMKSQGDRMANLLDQLSVLAKIESSTNVDHQVVNISQLILDMRKSVEVLQSRQQIQFEIEPNIFMQCDLGQMQSAISNLIYNAIRHAGENAHIWVRWQKNEKGATFSVSDNGIGIEPHHLAHLTERFYRVDESRSNKTGGSGLGLAIVKHALEQHHSYLEIQSNIGKGSQFSFTIKTDLLIENNH